MASNLLVVLYHFTHGPFLAYAACASYLFTRPPSHFPAPKQRAGPMELVHEGVEIEKEMH